MYYGGNDWLADVADVNRLLKGLPKEVIESTKFIPDWMHLDFIWGMDAPDEVYKSLIADAFNDLENV